MFFKEYIQKKALKKIDNERVSVYRSLNEIKSVGFIFSFEEENILESIKSFIEILDSRSVKFSAIGINRLKHPYPKEMLDYRITLLNRCDLNYAGVPYYNLIEQFIDNNYNLYIDFSTNYNFTSDYITRLSKSSFIIGRVNYQDNPYDLILDTNTDGAHRSYLNSIIHYLSSIRSI